MTQKSSKLTLGMLGKVFGVAFFVYLFFGFMLLPLSLIHISEPTRPY